MVRWNSLSYEIENTENNRSLIQDIERFKIGEYDSDKNVFTIRTLGMSSVIFNLEDYIDSQLYFQGVVRFFQNKDFSKELSDEMLSNKNFSKTDEKRDSSAKKNVSLDSIELDLTRSRHNSLSKKTNKDSQ